MEGDCTVDGGGAAGGRVSARVGLRRPVQRRTTEAGSYSQGNGWESVITGKSSSTLTDSSGAMPEKSLGLLLQRMARTLSAATQGGLF